MSDDNKQQSTPPTEEAHEALDPVDSKAVSKGAYPEINPADAITTIESMCENCGQNGTTRLLLHTIPFFREVILMAFECPHCYFKDVQIQRGGQIGENATTFELSIVVDKNDKEKTQIVHDDLNRRIVRSESAIIQIPEIEFEIPPNGRSEVTTVEGILSVAADNLQQLQPQRVLADAEIAAKIQTVIDKLHSYANGEEGFTFVMSDTGGNSFVENPAAPARDPRCKFHSRPRTRDELIALGYRPDDVEEEKQEGDQAHSDENKSNPRKVETLHIDPAKQWNDPVMKMKAHGALIRHESGSARVNKEQVNRLATYFDIEQQQAVIPAVCSACHQPAEARACVVDIPFFREVILMSITCEHCGYKDAEIKPGGAVAPLGRRVILTVKSVDDLKRDILKSDSSAIIIPELELEMPSGALAGKYTSLEGVLADLKMFLTKQQGFGDSMVENYREKLKTFFVTFDELAAVKREWTFILDDPLGNAYIWSPYHEKGQEDPQLKIEDYERTFEQNEDYGLNDMKTENYQTEDIAEEPEHDAKAGEEPAKDGAAAAPAPAEEPKQEASTTTAPPKSDAPQQ